MKKSLYLIIILALSLVVVLNGCGPTATPSPNPKTVSITSSASLDGDISCQNPSTMSWGVLTFFASDFASSDIFIGSQNNSETSVSISRGLLSFDLSALAGKTITNAVLKVHILTPINNPFIMLGLLKADHFTTNYTAATVVDSTLVTGMSAAVSGDMADESGWRSINVTAEVQADTGGNSQYRLYFQNELWATLQHGITIESGNNASNKPVLTVTYQ